MSIGLFPLFYRWRNWGLNKSNNLHSSHSKWQRGHLISSLVWCERSVFYLYFLFGVTFLSWNIEPKYYAGQGACTYVYIHTHSSWFLKKKNCTHICKPPSRPPQHCTRTELRFAPRNKTDFSMIDEQAKALHIVSLQSINWIN